MTLRSMTAYGRALLSERGVRIVVELQSVNRKHLEFHVHLPTELFCFEIDVKKWLSNLTSRGQLNLRVEVLFENEAPIALRPNLTHAAQLKNAWEAIAKALEVSLDDSQKIQLISQSEGLISYENTAYENEELKELLKKAVLLAVEKLNEMKSAEGSLLQKDISGRLEKLEDWLGKIESIAPEAVKRHGIKLRERLVDLLKESPENDERILREVSVYAERIDVMEEIIRLKSHIQQFGIFLYGPATDIGKTLDFLVQEMKREVNTICSKSVELEIIQIGIEMKSELERIREQIQNVE
jgi:uncharacterized protein (TIGR00255 family)